MFHIRPNKAGLYVARVTAAVTSAFDKNVPRDRYLSSSHRALVDIGKQRRWVFREDIDILQK